MNVVSIVNECGRGNYGLADLVEVRARLTGMTRAQQDNLIQSARRALAITATMREGRYKPTAEQLAANLPDNIGFLSVRETE